MHSTRVPIATQENKGYFERTNDQTFYTLQLASAVRPAVWGTVQWQRHKSRFFKSGVLTLSSQPFLQVCPTFVAQKTSLSASWIGSGPPSWYRGLKPPLGAARAETARQRLR